MWKESFEKLLSSKRKFTLCIVKDFTDLETVLQFKGYEVKQIIMTKWHNYDIEKLWHYDNIT